MTAVSPVIPGFKEIVFAKNQPEYIPLPVILDVNGKRLSRYTFNEEERQAIMEGSDLFICVHNLGYQPPVALTIYNKKDITEEDGTVILNDFNMAELVK
jgi:hypothetical protein